MKHLEAALRLCESIEVNDGRLVGIPRDGQAEPWESFSSENWLEVMIELSRLTKDMWLQFDSYSTGRYQVSDTIRSPGVTLQFNDICTGSIFYSSFNCELTFDRSSKSNKKGDPYPDGRFRLKKRSSLHKKWNEWNMPRTGVGTIYRKMGLLKEVIFEGFVEKDEKLQKKYLRLLQLNWKSIEYLISQHATLHKTYIEITQELHKDYTTDLHKESAETQTGRGLEPSLTTGDLKCGISHEGVGVKGNDKPSIRDDIDVRLDSVAAELISESKVECVTQSERPPWEIDLEDLQQEETQPEEVQRTSIACSDPSEQSDEGWLFDFDNTASI